MTGCKRIPLRASPGPAQKRRKYGAPFISQLAIAIIPVLFALGMSPQLAIALSQVPTSPATFHRRELPIPASVPDLVPSFEPSDGSKTSRGRPIQTYEVRPGDTVEILAQRFGISPETIIWANELPASPSRLTVGKKLIILPVSGVLHRVEKGDRLVDVVEKHRANLAAVVEVNGLQDPFALPVGRLLVVPGGQPMAPRAAGLARAMPSSRGAARPSPAGLSSAQQQFLAAAIGPAQASQRETGVPASVIIAQAILESNWGTSELSKKANNFFGIKGREKGGTAGVFWAATTEFLNGRSVIVREPFRAYKSMTDSFIDHGLFLKDNGRYAQAMRNAADPKAFAHLVHQAGYATDPKYCDKLNGLLDKFNLHAFDLVPVP